MRGSPNIKNLPRSPETGRRTRDLISYFRKAVLNEKTPESTRKWAADWLLYLEGFTEEKPADKKPGTPDTPHAGPGRGHKGPMHPEESPAVEPEEETKLRELIKETENDSAE